MAWQLHNTSLCPQPTGALWRGRNTIIRNLAPILVLGPLVGISRLRGVGVRCVGRHSLTTTPCWDTSGSVKGLGWLCAPSVDTRLIVLITTGCIWGYMVSDAQNSKIILLQETAVSQPSYFYTSWALMPQLVIVQGLALLLFPFSPLPLTVKHMKRGGRWG